MPDFSFNETKKRLVMRLWSLHPKYLDRQGLLAVWREGLLAKKVLEGKTRGYKHHSQLIRFTNTKEPLAFINNYLEGIYQEAKNRGYNFQVDKIKPLKIIKKKITVNNDQVVYEFKHLLAKLKVRDNKKYKELKKIVKVQVHSLFKEVIGNIEDWEKIKDK